jgi:hypothetical protein
MSGRCSPDLHGTHEPLHERPGVLTGVLSLDLLEQEGMIMASPEQRVIIMHQEEPMAFPESKSAVLLREELVAFQRQQQVVAVAEEMRRVPEAAADRHGSFRGSADRGSSLETGAEAFLNLSFSAGVPDVMKMFSRFQAYMGHTSCCRHVF